jgi:arylsulfatase A-like enzyme
MTKPRDIILLVADSLRYDSVFGRGAEDGGLPWASAHGVRFTQARSAGCWTLPATASMFTGLMPHEHGADAQSRSMRKDVPTLAEVLSARGYGTHQITANVATTEIFGLERGFDDIQRIWKLVPAQYRRIHEAMVVVGRPRLRRKLLSPDFISGQLAEDLEASKVWLQDTTADVFDLARMTLARNEERGKPSFLFLNLMETHFPYHVAPTLDTLSDGPIGALRELTGLYHTINQTWLRTGKQPISPRMMQTLRERQRVAWKRIAPQVDAFCREMHERGCLVVFCSDHGDNFGEQGWVYHFSNVSDAGNRVPLFWIPPDGDRAGTRIDTPVSAKDLFATLLTEVGDPRGALHLVREPERSVPVMQSCWYNNNGGTLPQYKFNQICLLEGGTRWMHRRGEWFSAPPTKDAPEAPFERLGPDFDPLEELTLDKERRAYLRGVLREFSSYAERLEA